MELKDKKVLVTGSSSGIGQAIAIAFAEKGAHVFINYRNNKGGADVTLTEVEKHTTGKIIQADLTETKEVRKLFDAVGEIDILVNNAGDAQESDVFNDEAWEYQHKSIFLSALYCIQQFLKQPEKSKKIINVTSLYGNFDTGNPELMAYSVYKSALNSLTKNIAKMSDSLVQVNAVAPGYTWTPAWEGISEKEKTEMEANTNIDRYIEPSEIAHMVVAIAENDAIHGEIITVDGGVSLVKGL